MTPAEVAAQLDARWEEWAVAYGPLSRQFIAMYIGSTLLPEGLETMIASQNPERVEERMAAIKDAITRQPRPGSATWAGEAQVRSFSSRTASRRHEADEEREEPDTSPQ